MRSIRLRLGVVLLVAGLFPAAAQEPSPPAAPAAASTPGYAGSDVCGTCHEDIGTAFAKNPHHILEADKKRGWEGNSCESCHGLGQKHAESTSADDIRNPSKLAAAAVDKLCLTCHLGQPVHAGRLQSSHARDQVACTTCHKMHAEGAPGLVARKPIAINEQCNTCHLNVNAQFQKPFHHRLLEGAMSCTDCHDPHGSTSSAMTRTFGANETRCFACHGDKRGPFMFEHAPVRFEGCATCHETHGSNNPRMLTRPNVQQLCLECHSNLPNGLRTMAAMGVTPPAFHDLRSPRYRNCTVCHQKIHGSHVDRNLLR